MLAKAYLRRGYAYEALEKLHEAKQDMLSVKELQPHNHEATKGVDRLNKALKEAAKVDLSDVELKIAKIKEAGNAKFQAKAY